MLSHHKDIPYDPTPYEALGRDLSALADCWERMADLMLAAAYVRPKFLAARLNAHSIPNPSGGAWTWKDVDEFRQSDGLRRLLREPAPHQRAALPRAMRIGRDGRWGLS